MNMNFEVDDDDQMVLISHPVGTITQLVPQQAGLADKKPPRRRHKKKQGGEGDGDVAAMKSKRKLSAKQIDTLEQSFRSEQKLETDRKDRLAAELGLDPRQVAVWFQNRRVRWRSKAMEEEYSRLRFEHETTVVEKCRLEAQILKLKEQLNEADKEMQVLSRRLELGFTSNNSPSSSSFVEPLFLEGFGIDGLENMFYMPENYNYAHDLEWGDGIYYV